MSIFIKTMSDVNVPDTNTSKPFSIFVIPDGVKVDFDRDQQGNPLLIVPEYESGKGGSLRLGGNSYVMDGNRTVSTFSASEFYSTHQLETAEARLRSFGWFNTIDAESKKEFMQVLCALESMPQGPGNEDRVREVKVELMLPANFLQEIRHTFTSFGFGLDLWWNLQGDVFAKVDTIQGWRVETPVTPNQEG